MPKIPFRAGLAVFALCAAGGDPAAAQLDSFNQLNLVFQAMRPCRVLDTRPGSGQPGAGTGPLMPTTPYVFDVAGVPSCFMPRGLAKAALLNIVAVAPSGPGHLRIWPVNPTGPTPPSPNASVVNYVAGNNIANGIVVALCDDASLANGTACADDLAVSAHGSSAHVVVDLYGFFSPPGFNQFVHWGEGRPDAALYGRVSPPFGPCSNGPYRFGLSGIEVSWGEAAAACPTGTWVCSINQRGVTDCDTARPDDSCDGRLCNGTCIDNASTQHVGWVANASTTSIGDGVAVSEDDALAAADSATCARRPVWCCGYAPFDS
jgi:hypothetical protein